MFPLDQHLTRYLALLGLHDPHACAACIYRPKLVHNSGVISEQALRSVIIFKGALQGALRHFYNKRAPCKVLVTFV